MGLVTAHRRRRRASIASFHSLQRASQFCSVTVSCGLETAFTFMELEKKVEDLNSGLLENLSLVAVRDKRILTLVVTTTFQKYFSKCKVSVGSWF